MIAAGPAATRFLKPFITPMDPEQDIDEQKTYQTIQTSNALPPAEDPKRASGFLCGGTRTHLLMASHPHDPLVSPFMISPSQPISLFAECGAENHLQSKEAVRCRECGYRIMYKKRARRRTLFTQPTPHAHLHQKCSHALVSIKFFYSIHHASFSRNKYIFQSLAHIASLISPSFDSPCAFYSSQRSRFSRGNRPSHGSRSVRI